MKVIGLIGEHPNDTDSIKVLLSKYLGAEVEFIYLLKNLTGGMLDEKKKDKFNLTMKNRLRREFELENPDIVIFIRDLDAVKNSPDYHEKLKHRKGFFSQGNKVVDKK